MKKIYNAPTLFCVELCTMKMMALSLNGDESISSSNYTEYVQNVKENNSTVTDKSVWDNEW